jgi:hypothetical protein
MSFFGSSNKAKSVLLIDIASSSIGAAYARVTPNAPAAILYSVRLPIDSTSSDMQSALMLRTLDAVLRELRQTGAPLLRRRTGSGSVHSVHVHLGAPWQEVQIEVETFADGKPFVFTEALLEKAKKAAEVPEGRFRSEEAVLGAVLNGYKTMMPVGKKVQRAEVIVLNATIEAEVAKLIKSTLGSFSLLHDVRFSSIPSLVLAAIPAAFPHEKDYLVLRVSGEATELLFVKNSFPMKYASFPSGLGEFARVAKSSGFQSFPDGGDSIDLKQKEETDTRMTDVTRRFTSAVVQRLYEYTSAHALPRTLFLITDSEAFSVIQRALNAPDMHALWLSDEPLAIAALESKFFSEAVGHEVGVAEDLVLDLLSLKARG